MILSRFDIEPRLTGETRAVHLWARTHEAPGSRKKEGNRPRRGSWLDRQIKDSRHQGGRGADSAEGEARGGAGVNREAATAVHAEIGAERGLLPRPRTRAFRPLRRGRKNPSRHFREPRPRRRCRRGTPALGLFLRHRAGLVDARAHGPRLDMVPGDEAVFDFFDELRDGEFFSRFDRVVFLRRVHGRLWRRRPSRPQHRVQP